MSEVISSTRKHTYIIRTDSDISKSKVFKDKIKIIDEKSCEIMVDNKISISQIINEFNKNNVNVVDILSKRNELEELFIELTQK